MENKTSNIFMRMLLTEKVKLEPSFLHKNYRDEVLRRLKLKVEGICSRHGYIRKDTIEIHKICIGRIELIGLNGNTEFDVMFYADICNPLLGSILRCKVSNINKFGILAEAEGVIEAIIAKNSVNIHSDIDLDKIRIGDDILIEVIGKKYELNDKKISLIGRAVKDVNAVVKNTPISTIEKNSSKRIILDNEEEDTEDVEIELLNGGANSDNEDNENNEDDEEDVDAEEDADVEEDVDADDYDNESIIDSEAKSELDGNFFSDEDDKIFGSDGGDFEDNDSDVEPLSDNEI
jgi:DNA-directed RNA polymerase subunit E'/Rpb7